MSKPAGMVGLAAVALLASAFWWAEPAVEQPVQFPHKTHVQEVKLPCTGCHQRAEKGAVAGRPPTALCLACHSGESQSVELKKLRAVAEQAGEIPWKRVWRLPEHVFFPHRTHVVVAKVSCQTCHGPMETLDRPPPRPLKKLAMDDCIGCHERRPEVRRGEDEGPGPVRVVGGRRLSTDCNACHR